MKIVPVIFAAGKGKRLRPLTYTTPKPLISIKNDLSTTDFNIQKLIKNGFKRAFITISYRRDLFEKLANKYANDIEISLLEEKPMSGGHIGPLRDNYKLLNDYDILLGMNGDTYIEYDINKFLDKADNEKMLIASSHKINTIPKQLLCRNDKLLGINTEPPYFYTKSKNYNEYRNNIGLYLIPISYIKLVLNIKKYIGIFEKGDLADIAIKKAKNVESVELNLKKYWSYNTIEELENIRKRLLPNSTTKTRNRTFLSLK